MPLSLLVASSETPAQQDARRDRAGTASHETYARTLRALAPDCRLTHACCVTGEAAPDPRGFDGVVFPGSPIQMHEDTAETRAAARFMTAVFEAGTPSFGSCAGLQIAAVAAGGTVRPRAGAMEAGIARGISRTEAGRDHPLLAGRPAVWDAPAMHSTVLDRLPPGATVLAHARGTPVEAAEIRSGAGTFRGVQYHPEIAPSEIAETLRAQADAIVAQGMAADAGTVDRYARDLEAFDRDPSRRDLAWQLGLDDEVADPVRRTREIVNALRWLAGR